MKENIKKCLLQSKKKFSIIFERRIEELLPKCQPFHPTHKLPQKNDTTTNKATKVAF